MENPKFMNRKRITLLLARLFMLFTLGISLIIYYFIGSVGYGFNPAWVWLIALFALVLLFVCLILAFPTFGIGKRRLTVVLTFLFLMYVVLTGGTYFESNERVSFSSIHGIFDDTLGHGEVRSSIYIETRGYFVIPLICYFSYPKKPPYAINIYISDRTRSLNRICIETAYINYGDDERKYVLNRDKRIVPSYGAPICSFPAIIDLVKSCDIELSGYFTYSNGDIKRFRTLDRFELSGSYPDHGWRIYTLWSGFHD